MSQSVVKVKLVKSINGRKKSVKAVLWSLGLRKIGDEKQYPMVNSILGQINKVIQFVECKVI